MKRDVPVKEVVVVEKKIPVELIVPKEVTKHVEVPVHVHLEKVKEIKIEVPVVRDVLYL